MGQLTIKNPSSAEAICIRDLLVPAEAIKCVDIDRQKGLMYLAGTNERREYIVLDLKKDYNLIQRV